jgi:hypothetical protein
MVTTSQPVSGTAIKQAIEARDGRKLTSFYAENAVARIIDQSNPPGTPRVIKGRAAIGAFWDDICGRTMTHRVDTTVSEDDRLVFTQSCTYPDGAKVYAMSLLELENGQIVNQTVVQAWDE